MSGRQGLWAIAVWVFLASFLVACKTSPAGLEALPEAELLPPGATVIGVRREKGTLFEDPRYIRDVEYEGTLAEVEAFFAQELEGRGWSRDRTVGAALVWHSPEPNDLVLFHVVYPVDQALAPLRLALILEGQVK